MTEKDLEIQDLRRKLKAYEATGLEPEEMNAMKLAFMGREIAKITEFDGVPIDRLRELAKAEKDGRLVALSVAAGAELYTLWAGRVWACRVESVELAWERWSGVEFEATIYCDHECEGCARNDWRTDDHPDQCCFMDWGEISFSDTDLGKTVFFTREEAKAALKGGDEG